MTAPPRGNPDPVSESDLLAFVDARLDAARAAEIRLHLARCPQDAERIARDLAIRDGLKALFRPVAEYSAPAPSSRGPMPVWACLVLAAVLAVAGFSGGWLAAGGHMPAAMAEARAELPPVPP